MDYVPPANSASQRVQLADLQIPVLHRPFFLWVYKRARRFRLFREAISSLYTFSYGQFRDIFLALGHHFVQRDLIAQAEDIFYLDVDEVREIVKMDQPMLAYQKLVRERKLNIDQMQDIIPPETIFGHQAPSLDRSQGRELKGTPTSRGVYIGPVRVVKGIQDIGRVDRGDVLVIPYSDWGSGRRVGRNPITQFHHRQRIWHPRRRIGAGSLPAYRRHTGHCRWTQRKDHRSSNRDGVTKLERTTGRCC
jgi:hypothetical protein